MGPLRVHPTNPRYFTDGSGKALYLTGSHTWWNLQDRHVGCSPAFDYRGYLDALDRYHHNFFRLWAWEQATWVNWARPETRIEFSPLPYRRTGPGRALDGGPKFDLTRLNQAYFDRLRSRATQAAERGIYLAVMLFEGFSIEMKGRPKTNANPWDGHPFHRANNVNGIDGDPDQTGEGLAIHTLRMPQVTALEQVYVRKVIDTVNDLDNVLYEISNESHKDSTDWQYALIDFVRDCEGGRAKQHPIMMTFQYPGGSNQTLFDSPADAISPNPGRSDEYKEAPPQADGSKVVITDTDHLWGIGGNVAWVWKSFTRGLNPIFMDPWQRDPLRNEEWDQAAAALDCESIRLAMGETRRLAQRMDLAAMTPHNELASTEYCLASPGREYLAYLPAGGPVTLDLVSAPGTFDVEWLDPVSGDASAGEKVMGGAKRTLLSPLEGDAVLYVSRQ